MTFVALPFVLIGLAPDIVADYDQLVRVACPIIRSAPPLLRYVSGRNYAAYQALC